MKILKGAQSLPFMKINIRVFDSSVRSSQNSSCLIISDSDKNSQLGIEFPSFHTINSLPIYTQEM